MIRLWDKIRDWVLLFSLLLISLIVLLSANEPMMRGLRARALETTGSIESRFTWLGSYIRAVEENQALREENHRLSSEVARAREARSQYTQLRNLLGLKDSLGAEALPARIISKDLTRERNFLVLNVGSNDGVQEGMAVVDSRGILGKTVLVGRKYSKVMTYLNSDFRIPIKILSSDSDGLLRWDGERYDRLLLELVVRSQEVERGEVVVTSGYSGVFQKGYPIGEIDSVFVNPGMITWQIFVRPYARLDNATHVFVILAIPDPARILPDA
ncbi:MAG: rod shape-determining protein MreC [Rhodothermia bacterium]|nr:MAG: rod shape-determining protein MreC [Rhodothermia bacterium]